MITETLKPLLESYAYNILGSYEDARDVVQDVALEVLEKPPGEIVNEKAYLIKAVINRAINVKERQKKFIKDYTGVWLPEPVATGEEADTPMQRKELLSYSLMVLMEKLNPRERAVFILKEAFNYAHEEIAQTLDISTDNSRQLLRRAKSKVSVGKTYRARPAGSLKADQLLAAIQHGSIARLEALLHEDIVLTSDGGGKVSAARVAVKGQHNASRFMLGIYRKFYQNLQGLNVVQRMINHQPALLYYAGNTLVNCQIFTIEKGRVSNVHFVRNPDKLKNIQKID